MRRMALVSAAVVLAMVLASGVALAANGIKCPNGGGRPLHRHRQRGRDDRQP